MDQVDSQLYISDINDIRESPFSADRVITVCQDEVSDNVGCEYEWYNMSDGPDNKYGGDHSYEIFEKAATSLLRALDDGETVIIHCHKGQSRSASVAIAALGVYNGENYQSTYKKVKGQRPQIDPDDILVEHAKKFIKSN